MNVPLKAANSITSWKAPTTFILFLLSTSLYAQLTLDECHEKARTNHPLIKQYDLIAKSSEYNISNANKAFLPYVSFTGIGAYIISGLPQVSIPGTTPEADEKLKFIGLAQVNQAIWDGGATRAGKNIQQTSAEVEKSNVDVSFQSLRERINQLFFGILVIDEQIKNLEVVNENLNRNLNNRKLSQSSGLAYQSDVDEIRAELLSLEQKRIEFRYARRGYIQMLSHFTGQPMEENIVLKKPELPESVTILENNRPELNLFASQNKQIQALDAMSKVGNMPKVGLMGAAVFITPGTQFATSTLSSVAFAGLSVSWNTSNIYKSSNNRELTKLQLNRVSNQEEVFRFGNKAETTQSSNEIEKNRSILQKDDEILSLKSTIKKAYQLKYDNGVASMSELIHSINKESEATSNRGLHEIQFLLSLYNYKLITGN